MIKSVAELFADQGGADALTRPLSNHSRRLLKGVRVKALTANTIPIYVGPSSVSLTTGFHLDAGEEVLIEIDDPSKVHLVAQPTQGQGQRIAVSDSIAGDEFKLSFKGETTAFIAVDATAAQVETALRNLSNIEAADLNVTGGPGPASAWYAWWSGQYALANQPLLQPSDASNDTVIEVTQNQDAQAGSKYSWIGQ